MRNTIVAANTRSTHPQSDANEAVTGAIADARLRLERSSGRYAHDLRELAAHLISAHLPSARTALLSKGHMPITFDAVIALVAVRDADDTLLWYDEATGYRHHPDAHALGVAPAWHHGIKEIENCLTGAYDAAPWRFPTSQDDHNLVGMETLLELELMGPSVPAPVPPMPDPALEPGVGPARSLVVQRNGHAEHASSISGEDSVTLLLDGHPVIGIDLDGLGLWRGDEEWERLHLDGTVTERYIRVDLTEDEFHGLSRLLSIDRSWFGRWRGQDPGERRTIILDNSPSSCRSEAGLDLVIAYFRSLGLRYEESRIVFYPARRRRQPASITPAHQPATDK
ncbi:hypothetical protein [Micromonospora sp. NPDC049204]|uniref:hypothetical protein n=1 Tax=Micromonospora sp. NPDC049204 TaxID=3154351 RepID=UPI0033F0234A